MRILRSLRSRKARSVMQHDIRMDMRTQPVKVLSGNRIIGNVRNILDAKTNLCLRTATTACTTFSPNVLSLSALNLSVSPNTLSLSALSLAVMRLSVTRTRTIRSNAEGRAGIRHAPRVLC